MLLNHLKIAFRILRRRPFFSWINIGGLALSLAAGLLMLLWIWDELKVNRFQVNGERLFKVHMGFFNANDELEPWENSSYPLGQAGKEQIPEVEDVISIGHIAERPLEWDNRKFKARGMDASMNIFDWMSFPVLQGAFDRSKAEVAQLAISRSMAERLFGNNWQHAALGQPVKLGGGESIEVALVFENVPVHSTLQFDFVTNVERWPADRFSHWGNHSFQNYLLLSDPGAAEKVRQKITEIYLNSEASDDGEFVFIQSMQQEYLYSRFDDAGRAVGGRIEYVRIFFFAVLFLLLIACVNFVNLSTARASLRAKEVGIRKIVGARKAALIRQFFSESGVITLLSVALALIVAAGLLPQMRQLTGKAIFLESGHPVFWLGIAAIFIVTAILAGTYPALFLSSMGVKNILQGKWFTASGHAPVRRVLVVFQFALSFVLIVGALVVQRQIMYIKNKNLGLDRENVIQVPLTGAAGEKYEVIKKALLQQPGVATLSITSENPLEVKSRNNSVDWPGKQSGEWKIHFDMLWTEDQFPEVFGVNLSAGRFYQTGMQADSNAVVINETAVSAMGIEDPIGKKINVFGQDRQIIGVVKDFHTMSFYQAIPPVVINQRRPWDNNLFIRSEAGKTAMVIAGLESVMDQVVPGYELEFSFLDIRYEQQYRTEAVMGILANAFALFSILISCLGILGLATFSAENRSKEIGVRRVLGATVFQIVRLLSRDFIWLVTIAALIALPAAFYFSRQWLSQFAYQTTIAWWVFAIAFILIIGISMLTVGIQGYKAGAINPVRRLRSE